MAVVADLRHLAKGRGFRTLAGARVLSQMGDGIFQAGLASLLFFSPESADSTAGIAIGIAILFGPFTLVAPLVGPLIDRWFRQRILMWGNAVRLVLAASTGLVMATMGEGVTLYVIALLCLSLNRFLLAAMSAALPQVVEPRELLTANSLLPTLGTIAALVGFGIGLTIEQFAPKVNASVDSVAALMCAGIAFGASAWVASRFSRRELGPDAPLPTSAILQQVPALYQGLVEGARYLRARRTPWHALGVMGAQRLLYVFTIFSGIVMVRNDAFARGLDDATAQFGVSTLFAGAGFAIAAFVTPTLGAKVPRHRWIVWCLLVGAAGQVIMVANGSLHALWATALVISFAVQGGKIAVDTIVQRDTDDGVRGRAFSLYDMTFNLAYVGAAILGFAVLPTEGYSSIAMGVVFALYLALAALYARAPREPSASSPAPA